MSELIICEFPWQVGLIKEHLCDDQIVIAFNAPTSYALERQGITFSDLRGHYNHEELWAKYPSSFKRAAALTAGLDEIVWKVDKRFREEGLRIFDLLQYPIKILLDQASYFAFILGKLLTAHSVTKITCLEITGPHLDNFGLFEETFSLVSWIIDALRDKFNYAIEFIQYPKRDVPQRKQASFTFFRGQRKLKETGQDSLLLLKHLRDSLLQFRTKSTGRRDLFILSVGCKELESLRASLSAHGILIKTYEDTVTSLAVESGYLHTEKILHAASIDRELRTHFLCEGVDLFKVFSANLRVYLDSLDFLLEVHGRAAGVLATTKIDAVVLESLAPFYLSNVFIAHLAKKRGIPLLCWMHGGYGANYSLPGYDVTDFRTGKYHLVYGEAVKNVLESPLSGKNTLGFNNHTVYVTGSPYFDKLYRRYTRPSNNHRRILLTIGNQYKYNSFYFGYNRPYAEFCNWAEHRAIIEVLVRYQDRYDIVIKDYPHLHMRDTWELLLADLGGDKVAVITDGAKYEDVLVSTDLHVFSWVSTPFMQSLYTDADIFLLDTSDITAEAKRIFERSIVFSADVVDFVGKLDGYLAAGKFYTQDKALVRRFFIDYGHRDRRGEIVSGVIRKVIANAED